MHNYTHFSLSLGSRYYLIKINKKKQRELNLMVKYVTFNHSNMSSNLIALIIMFSVEDVKYYIPIIIRKHKQFLLA